MFKFKYCPQCATEIKDVVIEHQDIQQCSNCQYINWRNPKPVVSIIIYNSKNEVLMLKRANDPLKDCWVLPGGFITLNESPQEAIVREAKEEIGQEPVIKDIIGGYLIDNDPRGNHIDIIYSGEIENDKIMLSHEHSEYKYFPIKSLSEKIAYKHREAIKDWGK